MASFRFIIGIVFGCAGLFLALPLCLAGLPFLLVSILTRRLAPVFDHRPTPWGEAIQFHPVYGWTAKPHLDIRCQAAHGLDHLFHVTTDANGWRGNGAIPKSDVLVFGDSFAWGYGIDDDEFFADLSPRVGIKSIGVPGYNLVQELLWMKEYSKHFRNKLIVWLVFDGNDLYDNVIPNLYHYRMPFLRKTDGAREWEIVTSHLTPTDWPWNYERNSREREKYLATYGRNVMADRVYAACEYLIKEGRDLCERAGGRLVIVGVPAASRLISRTWDRKSSSLAPNERLDRHTPDDRIKAICEKVGVAFVAAATFLTPEDHIPLEGHWNAKGHRRIAELIEQLHAEYLQRKIRSRAGKANQEVSGMEAEYCPPLVSIGVPVYNGEKILKRALDSILAQTYRNLEIIICDNASTDGTEAICREYASRDARVRYFRYQSNIGCNPNFWRTFEKSSGELFMWGAADDVKPPTAVASCVDALLKNPQAVLAYGPVFLQGPGWKEIVRVDNPMPMESLSPAQRIRLLVSELKTNVLEYGLYRREALGKGAYGDHSGADTLFLLQMCLLGPFVYTSDPMLIYQERGSEPRDLMYHEVPLGMRHLLTAPPHIRRKCWNVLLRGVWYLGRIQGPSLHDKTSAIAVYVKTYVVKYRRRLAREIVFQLVDPLAKALSFLWDLSKRMPMTARIGKHVHRMVMKA
jgi:glycosyltransferase involved in cell wall biosynthesis